MPVVPVRHATGQYQVHVEPGILLSLPELLTAALGRRKLVLITDDIVGRYYDEWTRGTAEARALGARSSDAGIRLRCEARLSFPAGEESKTRETWIRLSDEMLGQGLDRQAAIVALGGGVVGDLAGFVAATFMRGIPVVQVPTSLLAMVDASVGGKVGVDTPAGKNLVGAFHQPHAVLVDPTVLQTLDPAHRRAGMAEVLKHGIIADPAYLEQAAALGPSLIAGKAIDWHGDALAALIARSIEIKADVVRDDEREGGVRQILNFGHTIGHAIEAASDFSLLHGDAVAIGMVLEGALSERLGIAEPGTGARIRAAVEGVGLPTARPMAPDPLTLLDLMRVDKKARRGRIVFALPSAIGRMAGAEAGYGIAVDDAEILGVLQ